MGHLHTTNREHLVVLQLKILQPGHFADACWQLPLDGAVGEVDLLNELEAVGTAELIREGAREGEVVGPYLLQMPDS